MAADEQQAKQDIKIDTLKLKGRHETQILQLAAKVEEAKGSENQLKPAMELYKKLDEVIMIATGLTAEQLDDLPLPTKQKLRQDLMATIGNKSDF